MSDENDKIEFIEWKPSESLLRFYDFLALVRKQAEEDYKRYMAMFMPFGSDG